MITIKRNPNGDTRTAPDNVTFEEFQTANDWHREDVANVMYELSRMVNSVGRVHDSTKKPQERMFFRDFLATMNDGADFIESEWYKLHTVAERHHLLSNCPEDVNLIDVMEMVVDCVCSGLARSGETRELEIDTEILNKAVNNTVKLIESMVTVK